jgi:hypothetical protein
VLRGITSLAARGDAEHNLVIANHTFLMLFVFNFRVADDNLESHLLQIGTSRRSAPARNTKPYVYAAVQY